MRPAFVESIAVIGPGLADWHEGQGVLREPSTYRVGPLSSDGAIALRGRHKRRRTTPVIRLALQVVDQLTRSSSLDLSKATSVFASAVGDLQGLDGVCTALAAPDASVSPLQFHNVIHNIPAGTWSRAAGATAPSTSLSAGDATFAAGLIEAIACLGQGGDGPVLLVCYDHPGPAVTFPSMRPLPSPWR
jgi:3-oxoacyl-(acyl-carrier-protein) synthase